MQGHNMFDAVKVMLHDYNISDKLWMRGRLHYPSHIRWNISQNAVFCTIASQRQPASVSSISSRFCHHQAWERGSYSSHRNTPYVNDERVVVWETRDICVTLSVPPGEPCGHVLLIRCKTDGGSVWFFWANTVGKVPRQHEFIKRTEKLQENLQSCPTRS